MFFQVLGQVTCGLEQDGDSSGTQGWCTGICHGCRASAKCGWSDSGYNVGLCSFVVPLLSLTILILSDSLQFGDKPETPLFSNTWADHDQILVNQLANFASRYEFCMLTSNCIDVFFANVFF
jgi:hypothetical protein